MEALEKKILEVISKAKVTKLPKILGKEVLMFRVKSEVLTPEGNNRIFSILKDIGLTKKYKILLLDNCFDIVHKEEMLKIKEYLEGE